MYNSSQKTPKMSHISNLMNFKPDPRKKKSDAIGGKGLSKGRSTSKQRVVGSPSVKEGGLSSRISMGTQRTAIPKTRTVVRDKCDPTSEYWDEETQSCKPIKRDDDKKPKYTAGQAGTAIAGEPMQTRPEQKFRDLDPEELSRQMKEYKSKKKGAR